MAVNRFVCVFNKTIVGFPQDSRVEKPRTGATVRLTIR